jgi:rRNA maturation endonuclease Nob1
MKKLIQSLKESQVPHIHTVLKPSRFCPECGESIVRIEIHEKYVCSKCRVFVNEKDKFCFMCGGDLQKKGTEYWDNNQELDKAAFSERILTCGIDKRNIK